MRVFSAGQRRWTASVALAAAVIGGAAGGMLGVCGPFNDFTDAAFCPFVLEIFYLGITSGTTPTTYDPSSSVSRLQMAAFLSRSVDRSLQRGSRRAALNQFWTTTAAVNLGVTGVGTAPFNVKSDGVDLWVTNNVSGTVSRVRGSDGLLLQTWTAADAFDLVVAMGKVFITGNESPGKLYQIDPSPVAGAATTVATNLGNDARGITFDGARIWTANRASGSVSIVTPGLSTPYTVTTVTAGFTGPFTPLYDGANVWVTDNTAGTLLKLDSNGAILQTVTVGTFPANPVFDGNNIWVPNFNSNSVTVVRASNGAVLTTLTGNGLNHPLTAAFDGQRILVTNSNFGAEGVSLWKAADFNPLGFTPTGASTSPDGACSDGVNFWVTLEVSNQLMRF